MGTFFPIAFLVDTSCNSFSKIQPVVEGGPGEENFGGGLRTYIQGFVGGW